MNTPQSVRDRYYEALAWVWKGMWTHLGTRFQANVSMGSEVFILQGRVVDQRMQLKTWRFKA